MADMGRIAALAIVAALCAVVVRKQAPEIAMVLVLLGAAVILSWSFSAVSGVKAMMDSLREAAGLSPAVVALSSKRWGWPS